MKRTQLKDALRNIRRQGVSYLSVILIAFLGVTAYLGMDYAAAALRRNGSAAYEAMNFRDLEAVSTLLLPGEAAERLRGLEGVRGVEEVWQTSAKVSSGTERRSVSVMSLTARINRPEVLEGALPEAPDECAAEKRLAEAMGWRVGDTVDLPDARGQTPVFLTRRAFRLTAIVNHPDRTNPEAPEPACVLVLPEAFAMGPFEGCFMKAEIEIDNPAGIHAGRVRRRGARPGGGRRIPGAGRRLPAAGRTVP